MSEIENALKYSRDVIDELFYNASISNETYEKANNVFLFLNELNKE